MRKYALGANLVAASFLFAYMASPDSATGVWCMFASIATGFVGVAVLVTVGLDSE